MSVHLEIDQYTSYLQCLLQRCFSNVPLTCILYIVTAGFVEALGNNLGKGGALLDSESYVVMLALCLYMYMYT